MDAWLSDVLLPLLLVLCRIGGIAIFGPLLGSPAIPMRLRALLCVALAAATGPIVLGQVHVPVPHDPWRLVPIVGAEIAIGAVIGLLASIPMIALQIGGLLCGQQLGLGFGRFYLPAMDDEGDALEQMYFLLALVLFVSVGGVEQMVLAAAESYRWLPAGGFGAAAATSAGVALVGLLGGAFELALRVAAPVLAIVAIESIALGFVGRTVPAINILSVGFPLRVTAGVAVIAFGTGAVRMALDGFLETTLSTVRLWATGGAG